MLDKTVMDKLLLVPVHKPDQLDSLQALNLVSLKGYASHATGDGSITVSTNDQPRASGYAMGYADPETPTTSATAALPFLLLGEPEKPQPLKRGLLLLVLA